MYFSFILLLNYILGKADYSFNFLFICLFIIFFFEFRYLFDYLACSVFCLLIAVCVVYHRIIYSCYIEFDYADNS